MSQIRMPYLHLVMTQPIGESVVKCIIVSVWSTVELLFIPLHYDLLE